MDVGMVMSELEQLGTAQNRKVYARHGAPENQFGVSFANLGKLKKKLSTDHTLAEALWSTGNADARVLACMVADADAMAPETLDTWLAEIRYYVIADAFATLVSRGPHALDRARAWIDADGEFEQATGWEVLTRLIMSGDVADRDALAARLDQIERTIQSAPNRARHSMNATLIAIGGTLPELESRALEVAAAIGVVDVDHGETGCTTPDAAGYIARMVARRSGATRGGKKRVRARA